MSSTYAIRGNLIFTKTPEKFTVLEHGYLICEDRTILGAFPGLPDRYRGMEVTDYGERLIIPGLSDLHLHAPQYGFRGMGHYIPRDGWTTWFDLYAFPEESRYADLDYARRAYTRLADDLLTTTTTRFAMFATLHRPATELLMELLSERGFAGYVGKLNMDRNSLPGYQETTEETIRETILWLNNCQGHFGDIKPIVTPRYTPTSTDTSMEALGKIVEEYRVPVMSHLSEGLNEIEWVKELKPGLSCYGEAYDMYGMFGSVTPTIMAHCVYPNEAELALMSRRNVTVAHCAQCNLSLGNIAPIRTYLEHGIRVGLGTDVAGGDTLELLRHLPFVTDASYARWNLTERQDPMEEPKGLDLPAAFYLASKGGGSFFPQKAGSFEEGFCFDAVVLDDQRLSDEWHSYNPIERLERLTRMGDDREIHAKYINGKKVL